MFEAQDEFDLTDAGIPTLVDSPATITGFEVIEKENGVLHELTYEVEGLGFPVTKGYWFSHNNPKAANAGRGQLKRIAIAAIGAPKYGSDSLVGRRIRLSLREGDDGFVQVTKVTAFSNGA